MVGAGLFALGVIGVFTYSFLYAGPPDNFGKLASDDVPKAGEVH